MRSRRRPMLLSVAVLAAALAGVQPVVAHEGHPEDGQHGVQGGHLPASSKNVQLVGKLDNLTNVPSGIADVAAFGDYAYLAAYHPECAGRPGAQGTGVHVVDISDPANPAKVSFIPAHPNSYVGEGVHVMHVDTQFFTGDVLVHNNETCDASKPAPSGVSIWDVTDPRNPRFLAQGGDTTPALALQTYHTTHSVQGFTQPGRAYVVLQDNQDLKDVDILDITNPTAPFMLSETGLEDWPGAWAPLANGDSVFHHDMQHKRIDGHDYLLVSYWDAGQILLNVDNPASPVFVTDSDFPRPDSLTPFEIPEGNSHQSYWGRDGKYVLSSDEDFSPTRTLFRITSGPAAGEYGAGQFGWTVPIPASGISSTGGTVWGGSGCIEDLDGNGVSDRADVPSAASTGADTVVFSRGTCFFSHKVESGQLAGYRTVIVGQSHGGTRGGMLPDGSLCGSQGHAFTPTVFGLCIGHRAMHLLFDDAPGYTGPESFTVGGDMPAIGTRGQNFSASTAFDGWGYVHLHDGSTLANLDTYAIPEAFDPAYASGFGNLTVHEVKTDPRMGVNLAYLSYYDAGLRVVKFGADGITEVGHYIAEGGNDFWGTFPHCVGQCLLNDVDRGRGRHGEKRPLLLMSDRDSGLWIFRYTGSER